MKQNILRVMLLITLIILLIFTNMTFVDKNKAIVFTLPELPRPIAKAPVVITSAGQSTDSYIVRDISNQLMISSFFMPQAKYMDLKDINTVVFVVGYSSIGMKFQNISYDEEKERIQELLEESKNSELKVITIVLGGEHTHDKKTEELLRLIGTQSDYLIGLRESSKEGILTELAKEGNIPLTLVNGVNDISEPFASAFR